MWVLRRLNYTAPTRERHETGDACDVIRTRSSQLRAARGGGDAASPASRGGQRSEDRPLDDAARTGVPSFLPAAACVYFERRASDSEAHAPLSSDAG